jgi:DNA-binding MarR family transcriptional regulator
MSHPENRAELELYAEAAEACACNNFRKASRAITQLFDQTLEPSGLRSTQLAILLEIGVAEIATVPQLARRLVMDRSTLQRNIQPLIKRQLIKVRPGKARRARELTLTSRGRKAVDEAVPLWQEAQSAFVKRMGDDHWGSLRKSLSAAVTAARGAPLGSRRPDKVAG